MTHHTWGQTQNAIDHVLGLTPDVMTGGER